MFKIIFNITLENFCRDFCSVLTDFLLFLVILGAHMRRASAELENRRRASLGTSRGLRADGTLDPYHAAILFRDSRGVSCFFTLFLFTFCCFMIL